MVSAGRGRSAALAASMLVLLTGAVPASAQQPVRPPPSLTDIRILFKLDPLLSGPTYGGERWLSPATFTSAAQAGTVGTVDVKVRGVDARGRPVNIVPEWTAADPDMVTVTPGQKQKDEFRITVKRAGESKLTVASQGFSKELVVKAKNLGNAIQVEISQKPASEHSRRDAPAPDPGGTVAADDAPVLQDEKAKKSYAVGVEMGKKLKGASLELDAELVSRGVRDALTGDRPLLTEGELKAALVSLRIGFQANQAEAHKQLAEKNKQDGEAFLAENKTREGVVALESGLQYKVLKAGDGRKPAAADTVVCHYRGTLVDGTEFDSSLRRNKPATFALKRVIKGWSEALQLMPVGSKWQLSIPPNLAYGARGARQKIGPNATLLFEVELLSIQEKPQTAGEAAPASPSLARGKSAKP